MMKTKRLKLWIPAIVALFLATLFSGCKDEKVGIVGLCPEVKSTVPILGAVNVPLNQVITATFNEKMNPATITDASFTVSGATPIAGIVTYSGLTATFTPSSPLPPNTKLTGLVKRTVKDLMGNLPNADYVWTFTTEASPTVFTDPANLATEVPLNKVVTAIFSTPMDPLTINATTFTIKQGTTVITGAFSYLGSTASFTPTSALTPNTLYTGTITTGAKTVLGTPMANNYVWTFTTSVPPTVITDPANNATGVILNKIVSATFSVPMDPTTLTATTFTIKQGTTPVVGTISYSGTTATFVHALSFAPNTVYTGTITAGAKNALGTPLAADYVWTFTTGISPTLTTDPANLATNVVLNKVVTASFSVPMDPSTISGTTFTLANGTTPVAGTVTYTGTTASFTPSVNLLPGVQYTGTITAGTKSLAGIPLAVDYVWRFTTGAVPIVNFIDPLNLATSVPINKVVSARFSLLMDPLSLNGTTFTLKQGTTVVLGTVDYDGTTASFVPSSNLLPGVQYTATITAGAKSMIGIPMAADYVWTFTTSASVVPTVTVVDPLNLALNVPVKKVVTARFSVAMDPFTLNGTTFTLKQGTVSVLGLVTYDGTTASFVSSADLIPGTLYTATITTGAKSLFGVPLAANYAWTFTTVAAIAPTVVTTDPANNSTGVALNKTISAIFSMPMDRTTIVSPATTFTLANGTTSVPGTVSYTNTTAYFVPTSNLLPGTTYTATITTAAKSAQGTPMASNYVWSFTTVPPVPPAIDLGAMAQFGAFGGNAGITNQGLNTIINNGGIGTTAASTLVTGFHDGLTQEVYTETPLNVGNSTGGIFTAPPAPGTAAKAAIATQALVDANAAYVSISPAGKPGGTDPGAGELGGLTLAPGIYKSASGTFNISNGPLTLDAKGDPNATWYFQTASGLTVGIAGPAGARSVILINGAQAKNVYWYVGSAATINGAGGGTMVGNIIATAGVTFSTAGVAAQTVLNGRAISLVASVTMVNTTINIPN